MRRIQTARKLDVRRLALPGCTTQRCGESDSESAGDASDDSERRAAGRAQASLKNLKPEDSASGPEPEYPSGHHERTQASTGPALACSLDLLFTTTASMAAHVNLKSSFPPMNGLSCGHFLPVGSG